MNVRSFGQTSWTGGGLNRPKCSSQTHEAFSIASRAIWCTFVFVQITGTGEVSECEGVLEVGGGLTTD